jgi:putative transcriptional regulator
MANYNALCLEPVPEYNAAAVRALREKLKLSQAVLAAAINTRPSTVSSWEGVAKKPTGTASQAPEPD